ncbi:MAG: 1,4-alpha-glucan branching protein domain-containing protein [bacterium]|nr:1,4-alpha-glucan branching protein domain-containing protein [bacterium]
MNRQFQTNGLTLIQRVGPYVELFFDWSKLPEINLEQEYFLVRVTPKEKHLPAEFARPNSDGPLFFGLKGGASYLVELLKVQHLVYQVHSSLKPVPWVDLIAEHENLLKLVWGNMDLRGMNQGEWLEVLVDGKLSERVHIDALPESFIQDRPGQISMRFEKGEELFNAQTNLESCEVAAKLEVTLEKREADFFFSRSVTPSPKFQCRAEIEPFFDMRSFFRAAFLAQYPKTPSYRIGGKVVLCEQGKSVWEVRQMGFSAAPDLKLAEVIQTKEWGLEKPKDITGWRLSIQVTSRHREFYKFPLYDKQFDTLPQEGLLFATEEEVQQAQGRLYKLNPHASWDQSFVELALFFKVEGHPWQEFQREPAHLTRWDWTPGDSGEEFSAQWVLYDLAEPKNEVTLFKSGKVYRDHFEPMVVLKPHSDRRLLVYWELERAGVAAFVKDRWHCGIEEVGFYLKIHEEHLGSRLERKDLTAHLVDLFSEHQNLYIEVEPDRRFSAEIVARRHHEEAALTPVSQSIVTPRPLNTSAGFEAGSRGLGTHWHHTSQREVRHAQGHDSNNVSKVMLHLHMHSPNLFRVEPFRDSYLRDLPWPIRTQDGAEVHNPPGEWALRNCADAWLPLLMVFKKLADEGVDYQVSLDITPPVAYMISHPRFKDYMSRFLLRLQSHCRAQIALMKSRLENPAYIWAAQKYLDQLKSLDFFYNHGIHKDMIGAFRSLELSGFLELSTCTATHGMPACLETMPDSLDAQIALAARAHHRIFGDRPKGIWLAENSCFPGVDKWLEKEGLHYYFVEAESVLGASARPSSEEFNPLLSPSSNVVAFGRSRMGRVQVWDAEIGYAGHPDFREYHHRHWGLPLKRITSKTSSEKAPYDPDQAHQVAREMAQDFYRKLCGKADQLRHWPMPAQPLITCTYDAELFGHHWSEGPVFLEELLREFHRNSDHIGLTTPSHYLVGHPQLPEATPNPSTWGHEACHIRWTDAKVAWTQRELQRGDSIQRHYLGKAVRGELSEFHQRCVEQMGAELMRAESSDLTFVIISGDFEEDMMREIQKYLDYFYKLKYLIDNLETDEEFLAFRVYENDMFPEVRAYYGLG